MSLSNEQLARVKQSIENFILAGQPSKELDMRLDELVHSAECAPIYRVWEARTGTGKGLIDVLRVKEATVEMVVPFLIWMCIGDNGYEHTLDEERVSYIRNTFNDLSI